MVVSVLYVFKNSNEITNINMTIGSVTVIRIWIKYSANKLFILYREISFSENFSIIDIKSQLSVFISVINGSKAGVGFKLSDKVRVLGKTYHTV